MTLNNKLHTIHSVLPFLFLFSIFEAQSGQYQISSSLGGDVIPTQLNETIHTYSLHYHNQSFHQMKHVDKNNIDYYQHLRRLDHLHLLHYLCSLLHFH